MLCIVDRVRVADAYAGPSMGVEVSFGSVWADQVVFGFVPGRRLYLRGSVDVSDCIHRNGIGDVEFTFP